MPFSSCYKPKTDHLHLHLHLRYSVLGANVDALHLIQFLLTPVAICCLLLHPTFPSTTILGFQLFSFVHAPCSVKEMTSIVSSHAHSLSLRIYGNPWRGRSNKVSYLGHSVLAHPSRGSLFYEGQCYKLPKTGIVLIKAVSDDDKQPGDGEYDDQDKRPPPSGSGEMNSRFSREYLERLVGQDDASFSGVDLATLIRKKYGRSYDVQLIKKEFMGKNLLAMNVMWKYREQRSFPLTEEEYILRLDDVANTLKCWGAVSHIRNSLEKSKERPRIGKAVSIFIDMDDSGGRSNEWIYK